MPARAWGLAGRAAGWARARSWVGWRLRNRKWGENGGTFAPIVTKIRFYDHSERRISFSFAEFKKKKKMEPAPSQASLNPWRETKNAFTVKNGCGFTDLISHARSLGYNMVIDPKARTR